MRFFDLSSDQIFMPLCSAEELQHRKQQRQRKMRMEKKREQKLIASGTSGSSGRSSGNSGRSSGTKTSLAGSDIQLTP